MLVLKRKKGEGIRIDDDVLIKIVDIHQWKNGILAKADPTLMDSLEISVGIAAPEARIIFREEVWVKNQIQQAGEEIDAAEQTER